MKTTTNPKYICFNHLVFENETDNVILLGYRINLSATEHKIICAIANNQGEPLSPEQISSLIDLELSNENVAFHISNINRKAKCVSNRQLIKNIAKIGYFLNEEM